MRDLILAVFSAAVGAIVGSFLNACIHRMPRNISLLHPRRSFCPSCQRSIPWHENLPIISWMALRGKCSGCGARISPRYVLVEILTAAVFFWCWHRYGLPLAPVYWVFLALLIAATFIDIEHFIIPDEITWGGTVAGLVFCAALPALMNTSSHLASFGLSLAGAALGYGLLWGIVEAGKLAFGRKKHAFSPSEPFTWTRRDDTATLTIGEESLPWEEIFSRESDLLVLDCDHVELPGRPAGPATLKIFYNRLVLDGAETPLEQLDTFAGSLRSVVIPREAMGFGDVKFIAAIGAFLGWQAVLFTIFAASIIGCFGALAGVFLARDKAGSRVPFGPFLALGAFIWLFGGQAIWDWYFGFFRASEPVLHNF